MGSAGMDGMGYHCSHNKYPRSGSANEMFAQDENVKKTNKSTQ